jgi:hypothetical protein
MGIARSVTRTLRLEEDLDKAIGKRAADEKVSVNFLVTKALRKLVDWDIPVVEFGMVVVPDLLLNLFSGDKDEATFERFGRDVAREFAKPMIEYLEGDFTSESFVEWLRRVSRYTGRFQFDFGDGKDSRSYVVVLRHNRGRTWSRYYVGVLDEAFHSLLGEEIKVAFTDSLCVGQLRIP